jgi:hypothetical protein
MAPNWHALKQMDAAPSSRRVVIADDHPLMLNATSQVFADADGFAVVGRRRRGTRSTRSSPGRAEPALRGGAVAYIKKSIDPRHLPAVVRQALEGNAYKELFLSDQTVKFHPHKIYRKLRVASRTHRRTSRTSTGSSQTPRTPSRSEMGGTLAGPAHPRTYGVRETTNSEAGSVTSVFVNNDRN